MRINKIAIIIIFSSLIVLACNTSNNKVIKQLSPVKIPNKEEAIILNKHKFDYHLFINNDGQIDYSTFSISDRMKGDSLPKELILKINRLEQNLFEESYDEDENSQINLKIDDGWIIGFDRGEWSGFLYWFSENGQKHQRIINRNIVSLHLIDNEIFAFEGLLHMQDNGGSFFKVKKENSKWITEEVLKLKESPLAVSKYNEKDFLVATNTSFIQIMKSKNEYKIKPIIENGFWSYGVYPYSILTDKSDIYIGMRAGILKINQKDTEMITWYMDKN